MTGEPPPSNVVPIAKGQTGEPPRNGGRVDRIEGRVNEIDQRLSRIEGKLDHLATKEDVQAVTSQISASEARLLRWLIGVIAAGAISIVIALIRTFLPYAPPSPMP